MPTRSRNAIQRAEKTSSAASSSSTSTSKEDESSEEVYEQPDYRQFDIKKKIARQQEYESASRKGAIPLAPNQSKALKLAHKSKQGAIEKILESTMQSAPNQVEAVIRIKIPGSNDIQTTISWSTKDVTRDPYQSGPSHNHDDVDVGDWTKLTLSDQDAEARLFPKIEDFTFPLMNPEKFSQPKKKTVESEKKPEASPPHHHMITLVGPHGPCNGCQIRMQLFVRRWLEQAREAAKSGLKLKLTLCYIYNLQRHDKTQIRQTDKIKSGWKGKGELPKEFKFHYGVADEQTVNYQVSRQKSQTLFYYRLTAAN